MNEPERKEIVKVAGSIVMQCKNLIASQFPAADGRLFLDEPMSDHSSFKVGGPADLVFFPASSQEFVFAIKTAKEEELPFTVLGNGSNILVSDKGIRGITIILGKEFSSINMENDDTIAVDSGALLSTVAKFAARENLTGMEFAAGIPGSIGGAVYMNAGAYGGCMADIVVKTQGYDPVRDELFLLETPEEHQFDYRQSLYELDKSIVIKTWLHLNKGDHQEIERKMAEFSVKRKNSQPLEFPSAGSTFKRPVGYYAGRLIEEAGLKGCRIGGACVSVKHAGFIINDNKATAQDILELIHTVQDSVYKKHGISIDPEVRILGEW